VLVTTDNVITKEIQARLKASKRFYYALQAVLKPQIISRKVINIKNYNKTDRQLLMPVKQGY
jgi:hypothetical protein